MSETSISRQRGIRLPREIRKVADQFLETRKRVREQGLGKPGSSATPSVPTHTGPGITDGHLI